MKLNKNGFAISSIIYSILILFLLLIFGILSILGSRKLIFDKMKNDVMNKLNGDVVEQPKDLRYKDNSGAARPELVDKLIPVLYENNTWKVADIYQKWYDYDNKEWANAVILENGVTKEVGDTLNIDTEVAQMYVWIPRYEYSIPEYNLGRTDNDIHAINIHYIEKTTIAAQTGYYIHPGFTFGGEELSGIWVGKFETTGENAASQTVFTCTNANCTQKVTIKPGYKAAYGKLAHQFYAARSVEQQYSLSHIDAHMAKYTEWTAVSYLTNSIYGRCSDATHCTEVTLNNSGDLYTGNAANEGSTDYPTGISNAYYTERGMTASTTGNITGIYDMVGGVREYVMGVLLDSDGNPRTGYDNSVNSGFNGMIGNGNKITDALAIPDSKYYDSFVSNSGNNTYSVITHVNGFTGNYRGTLREILASPYTATTSWYSDYTIAPYTIYPWFIMGGAYFNNTGTGMFASDVGDGSEYYHTGFRIILAI